MSAEKEITAYAISDTHGHLPAEVLRILHDADFIFHAGDIGAPAILQELGKIAPVHAVRGNMDRQAWATKLPDLERVNIGTHTVCIVHDLGSADADFKAMKADLVIHGHTHRPLVNDRNGILYVNPGSASQPRSESGRTMAKILFGNPIRAEIVKI